MINNKRAGVGADEAVFLIIFIIISAIVYVLISAIHSSNQEQMKTDTSNQLIAAQMEKDLTQFLQLSVGDSTVKDNIIKEYKDGNYAVIEAVAKDYFANKKIPTPYKNWGIVVHEPGSPTRAIKLDQISYTVQEVVASAYLPLPYPESTYLEVKFYLFA